MERGCHNWTMIEPHITFRGMPHSPAMDERIRELTAKLEEMHPRITSVHVIVDELDRHHSQGNTFEVRIDVRAPQAEIIANRQRHGDPYVAMREAFDAVFRQMKETQERMRREVKVHRDERGDDARP